MILYTLWSIIFIIRIIIIIIGNKKLNSILDTESKIIHFMGSNKYIITKIKCWPVFKSLTPTPPPHSLAVLMLCVAVARVRANASGANVMVCQNDGVPLAPHTGPIDPRLNPYSIQAQRIDIESVLGEHAVSNHRNSHSFFF